MDKYGLIGFPLGHSFSISYFNEKFANEGIKARYINYEIPQIEDLKEILASNPELRGLNVTIPYKQQVIPYLDELSPEARAIGAVNVIRVTHKNKNVILKGFNSDVIGFTRSIETMLEPCHKKALILGTGGVARTRDAVREPHEEAWLHNIPGGDAGTDKGVQRHRQLHSAGHVPEG